MPHWLASVQQALFSSGSLSELSRTRELKMKRAAATVKLDTARNGLHIDEVGLQIAPAPGRPTVPRAELWAVMLAARAAPPASTVAK